MHARLVVDKSQFLGKLRQTEYLHQAQPVSLVGGADIDPAVRGLQRLVRRRLPVTD